MVLLGERFDVEDAVTFQKAQPFALVAFAETGGLARVGFGGQELGGIDLLLYLSATMTTSCSRFIGT